MGMGGILGAICLFFPHLKGAILAGFPHFGDILGDIWLAFSILKAILADFPSFWGTFWGKCWFFFSPFARGMLGVIWLFFGAVWAVFFPSSWGTFWGSLGCFFPSFRGIFGWFPLILGILWGAIGGFGGGKSGPQFWKIGAQIGPEFCRRPKKNDKITTKLFLAKKPYKTRA